MVRSPLVWLGEPDPIKSMDDLREEDYELANIRELFEVWLAYDLDLGTNYTTAQIIEAACPPHTPNNYAPQTFKQLLLRVAAAKNTPDIISADRLGWWLRRITGRIVSVNDVNGVAHRYRLSKGHIAQYRRAYFQLTEI
jgi:putative DNA primase/helicase